MSESRLVIAERTGFTKVLADGESITDTKEEAPGVVPTTVYVLGPQTQLDESEVPESTGKPSLLMSW